VPTGTLRVAWPRFLRGSYVGAVSRPATSSFVVSYGDLAAQFARLAALKRSSDLSVQVRRVSLAAALGFVLLLVITLVALALRLHQLGDRSLWVDEAMSVVFASKPLPELFQLLVTEDIHPPLYPVLLHYWMAIFGSSEFAARFPSLVFGVALIPLIYLVGRRLETVGVGRKSPSLSLVGMVAALIAATSTFYIGYSQEARNYMAVTFLGLLSSYLLLRALAGSRWRGWVAYGLATACALYTQYTAFLLLAFHLMFVALTWRSYRGAWRRWVLILAAVMVAYLPWITYSLDQLERISDYWPGTLQVEAALRTSFLLFVAGGGLERRSLVPMLLGLGLLVMGMLTLLVGASRRGQLQQILFLLLYLLMPSALLLMIVYYRPKFDPRYLLIVTPAFYLMLAWGIAWLFQTASSRATPLLARVLLPCLGAAALAGMIAVSSAYGEPAKLTHVGDGNMTQEYGDYRGLVSYVEAHARPGDAVVLMMNTYQPYVYYSKLGIPYYSMEPFDDFDGAIIRLNRMVDDGRHRLWFILWQPRWADPADYVMHVMETQAKEVPLDASFGGIGLRLFDLIPGQRFSYYPKLEHRVNAIFGDNLLEFWDWNVSSTQVAAGGSVRYDLHWIPQKKVDGKLKTKVMLVDGERHLWATVDEVMVSPFYPTSDWKVNIILHDRHILRVPAGVPPGNYDVWLIVYDENTMKDMPVVWHGQSLGTVFSLGTMVVTPTPRELFPPVEQAPLDTWYLDGGSVELLRSRVSRPRAKPGDLVEMELQWRSTAPPLSDETLRVALLNESGSPVGEQAVPLAPGYPATRWRPGEPVLSRHWLDVSALPPGRYSVAVAVAGAHDEQLSPIQYAQVSRLEIPDPNRPTPVPSLGSDRVDPLP